VELAVVGCWRLRQQTLPVEQAGQRQGAEPHSGPAQEVAAGVVLRRRGSEVMRVLIHGRSRGVWGSINVDELIQPSSTWQKSPSAICRAFARPSV